MIGKLKGKIVDTINDDLIIDVNGVGYRVEGLSGSKINSDIEIFTYTHVREQELRLFGFESKDALTMFEALLNVQGVGPKIALKLVNMINVGEIVNAILNEDSSSLKVPGLGEKLAKKIIIDLKNKMKKVNINATNVVKRDAIFDDVAAALISLGYHSDRIDKVLQIIDTKDKDQQGIIKEALRLLNQY
jgi:Holliday junction DNA helicase RuvA